jgi:hypothetical protein
MSRDSSWQNWVAVKHIVSRLSHDANRWKTSEQYRRPSFCFIFNTKAVDKKQKSLAPRGTQHQAANKIEHDLAREADEQEGCAQPN